MAKPEASGLDIRETIDGVSMARAAAPAAGERKVSTASITKRRGRPDRYIWGIYIALLIISVIELFSASSTEVSGDNVYSPLIRHAIFLVMGLGIVLWLQRTPYTIISKFSWILAAVSLILLLLSSFMGVEINGAQRAIRIAGMTIQPAEIVKLTVVCLLANILGKNQTPGGVTNRGVITAAIVVMVFCLCMFKDGMTNMLLMFVVSIAMMLIGGIQWSKLGMVLLIYVVGGGAIYVMKDITPSTTEFDRVKKEQAMLASAGTPSAISDAGEQKTLTGRGETRKGRIKRFIEGVHPDDKIDDMNRQVIFSKFALANGGGVGPPPRAPAGPPPTTIISKSLVSGAVSTGLLPYLLSSISSKSPREALPTHACSPLTNTVGTDFTPRASTSPTATFPSTVSTTMLSLKRAIWFNDCTTSGQFVHSSET